MLCILVLKAFFLSKKQTSASVSVYLDTWIDYVKVFFQVCISFGFFLLC